MRLPKILVLTLTCFSSSRSLFGSGAESNTSPPRAVASRTAASPWSARRACSLGRSSFAAAAGGSRQRSE